MTKVKIEVEAVKGGFADLMNEAVRAAHDESVEMGWFDIQGPHPTADMTFAELARFQATGGASGGKPMAVPQRDILAVTAAVHPFENSPDVDKIIWEWLDKPNANNTIAMLDRFGENYVEKIKGLFGSVHLGPTERNPDPLINTGALRDNTAHRNSKTLVVKK